MATNANVFNSRVTSEALEAKYRQVFPAQAGAELIQDLYASGVIQPVIDFSSVAEGSFLPQNLQTAWDFSTGSAQTSNTTNTLITTPGFWKLDLSFSGNLNDAAGLGPRATVFIDDGTSTKVVWGVSHVNMGLSAAKGLVDGSFVVFLRAGDELKAFSDNANNVVDVWYRQIADVNGNLVNPLGFTFQ